MLKNRSDYCCRRIMRDFRIGYHCLRNVMKLDDALINNLNPPPPKKESSSIQDITEMALCADVHTLFVRVSKNMFAQARVCFIHPKKRALWRDCACFN